MDATPTLALYEDRRREVATPTLRGAADRRDREAIAEVLSRAGVTLDGDAPWDMKVRDPRAYRAILSGSLGFGEAYMEGWWESGALDQLMERIFASRLDADRPSVDVLVRAGLAALMNRQSRRRAFDVARAHYDAGNDLFEKMLDPDLVYTCGYWRDATDLAGAQTAKLDLVCRKLGLEPGMRVLDIGCGYGSFMKFAAERYGVSCVGYSVSEEQTSLARARCEGLPIELVLEDYRAICGTFDRVVSIGMLEAVGYRNYRVFMEVVERSLVQDGLALIHTVGHNVSTRRGDPWVDEYIFPNGMLPSIAQLGRAFEGLLVMEDWHNFGPDYDRTLMAWNERFQRAWPELSERYTPRFKRMWELYLLGFAGGFRARNWQLWQIVLSKPGRKQPDCRVV
jgi:cyclopropane-fatty-acyl-phospholipid synthase